MDWKIIEANRLSPKDIDRQGNKFLTGNGYIGYRGTLEEFNKEQKTATIISGLYDKVGNQWREPVNLPNGCFVQVIYKGEVLHALTSRVVEHTQSLDMQNALHERETIFETVDSILIVVRARRFASRLSWWGRSGASVASTAMTEPFSLVEPWDPSTAFPPGRG